MNESVSRFLLCSVGRNKNELASVLTDPEKEDMEVCFPEHSSFHLGDRIYLNVDRDHIELKRGMMVIHKSLDYVSCFFGVLQRACDVRHGVSSTSMNQVIDAMLSAHRASFFLNSDCIVSPTRTMFVQESHVRGMIGW